MAENKKSFVLYADLIKSIEHFTNEEKGVLFNHLLEYVNDKNPILTDRLILTAWKPIELQLKRDLKEWDVIKEDRSKSGVLGNLKRWNLDLYDKVIGNEMELSEAEIIAKHRKASHSDKNHRPPSQPIANIAVTVNDTVTVNNNIEERLKSFQQKLEAYIPEYGEVMVKNFYNYWREKNESGNKMRFEREKVFDISLRLKRWKANQSKFSNSGNVIKPKTEMVATADGGLIDKSELNRIFKQ